MLYYIVRLFKRGRLVMVTNYTAGQALRNADGTLSIVDANWLVAEWHGRLGYGVAIETQVSA